MDQSALWSHRYHTSLRYMWELPSKATEAGERAQVVKPEFRSQHPHSTIKLMTSSSMKDLVSKRKADYYRQTCNSNLWPSQILPRPKPSSPNKEITLVRHSRCACSHPSSCGGTYGSLILHVHVFHPSRTTILILCPKFTTSTLIVIYQRLYELKMSKLKRLTFEACLFASLWLCVI